MKTATITMIENGPMLVKGLFEVVGADGKKMEFTPTQLEQGVYLCKCGKSQNKPMCDGSHKK